MGWRKKLEKAKRLHRPSLKDWECDGLYETFPAFVQSVSIQENYQSFALSETNSPQSLPLILDARTLTTEEFNAKYEAPCIPCVVQNIPAGYDGAQHFGEWAAVRQWPLETLKKDSVLLNRLFKCGEDDDGKSIKVKLKHFLRYLEGNRDDSPLYVFDSSFEDDRHGKKILSEYQVPLYFRDDLFRFISESRRPPYRWFLVGPERSGTTIHIDPLATNAWNTLIYGKKRWVLFPPHIPKHVVKGRGLIRSDEDDEAVHYFMYILPRIKRKALSMKDHPDYRDFACYEFTQNAGGGSFLTRLMIATATSFDNERLTVPYFFLQRHALFRMDGGMLS